MNHLRKILAAVFLVLAGMVVAQPKDQSYFEELLQDTLSSPYMNVEITGLTGTLSAAGRVEKIEIADDLGVWLVIENAEIDWTRSALLAKRVDIQNLAAQKITMFRTPRKAPQERSFEATGYSVPELPVGVRIDNISAETVILKPAVLGQSAEITLAGNLFFEKGLLNGAFRAAHTDGSGAFKVETKYDTAAGTVALDMRIREHAHGLIVKLLGIPEQPSIDMHVTGSGPTNQFEMELALRTDNKLRISGTVIAEPVLLAAEPVGTRFVADISGSLSPLFQPVYRPFFGKASHLSGELERLNDGSMTLSALDLSTAALDLKGALALAPDGTPQFVDITADLNGFDGEALLLPGKGPKTFLDAAKLSIDYTLDEPWVGSASISGLNRDGFRVDDLSLVANGTLAPSFNLSDPTDLLVTSAFNASAKGLSHVDPDIHSAMGRNVFAQGNLEISKGSFLKISNLSLENTYLSSTLDGSISGVGSGLTLDGNLNIAARDLSPLSGFVGQSITGNGTISAKGTASLLSGEMDFQVGSSLSSLTTTIPTLNKLMAGSNQASFGITRDSQGVSIDNLVFSNPQSSGVINAKLRTDVTAANISVQLNDAATIAKPISGKFLVSGDITQSGNRFGLDLNASGVGGVNANISGTIPAGAGAWDVRATGTSPLALLDQILKKTRTKVNGDTVFDLTMRGQPSLNAIAGTISSNSANLVLPSQQITLQGIRAVLTLANGVANTNASANFASGGTATLSGPIRLDIENGLPMDLEIQLSNVSQLNRSFYSTRVNGALNLGGSILQGPTLGGRIELLETEVNVAAAPQPALQFAPNITHLNEPKAVRTTRDRAGLTRNTARSDTATPSKSAPIELDILVEAPTRVFVRGRGLDAELGGQLHIAGVPGRLNPNGAFHLIRGRLDILGKRFDLSEGTMSFDGSFDPLMHIVALTTVGEYDTAVIVSGQVTDPKFDFKSTPELPQDEILAQMVFGRALGQISPFQAIQLASSIGELTGRGGLGFVSRIRETLKLDDFNIQTDEDGEVGLKLGKYISRNAYADVTVAGDQKSEVTINLDIKKHLTLRGTVEETGNSSVGVYFEKDY